MNPSQNPQVILQTDFSNLKLHSRGKVRDIYDLGEHLLIVATDRISAFDVVLPQGIPHKGKVLTQISAYWFEQTKDIVPNHLISVEVDDYPSSCQAYRDELAGRSMLVKKTKPLPVECIVRGYLSGSGWKDYQKTQAVCGIPLAKGLVESAKLENAIFTPSTKAEIGLHDENISFEAAAELVGTEIANRLREVSLVIYEHARQLAEQKGIIIADTKMEFGMSGDELILIDELLTPDSSRFWPADSYKPGTGQPSFDKQFVRDYLTSVKWDKNPPAPDLPDEVVKATSEKYLEAYQRLTERRL